MPWLDDLDDEPWADDQPPWFSACGVLRNGRDPGAAHRAAIREANARRQQAEADRDAQKGQDRAQRPQRATVPGKPPTPLRGHRAPTPARVHPDGRARLLEALS